MSLQIVDTPAQFQPVLSDGLFFTVSADTTNTFKFRYVYEVYVNNDLVFGGKCVPNPFGLGIIDLQQVLETYCANNPIALWDTTPIYVHETFPFSKPYQDETISYYIKSGYEYSTTELGPVTGFTGSGSTIGPPAITSEVYKTFRSTMGVNGRATQQDWDYTPFVLSGTPVGVNPTTSGLFLTNSPRYRRIDNSEYFTLAFTNYYLTQVTGSSLSEPYYVQYTFYDDQGSVISATTYENITTNGGGPRTNCNQVYPELYLVEPTTESEWNTLYVGAGPMNIDQFPSNTSRYTVQLFGKFTGTTSPIPPTPTPTPTATRACICSTYEIQVGGAAAQFAYLECDSSQYTLLTIPDGQTRTICACADSLVFIGGGEHRITYQGPCTPVTPTPTPTPACSGCTQYYLEYTGESISTVVSITDCVTGNIVNLTIQPTVIYPVCSCTAPFADPEVIITIIGPCTPSSTPSPTPTRTVTPTPSPSTTVFGFLGRTTPDQSTGPQACENYLTIRNYFSNKSLASLTVGDYIYDTYPSVPTNGSSLWVALTVGGVGLKRAFQIASDGEILDTYNC
jgi:hypothetical protein